MGGGAPQPQLPPGNTPIPVGQLPMWGQPTPNQALTPPQSMKGGAMNPLPSLQDVFNVRAGAPPLFPNSQSFPQAPFVRSLPFNAPDVSVPGAPVPGLPVIPATPPPTSTPPPGAVRPPIEDRPTREQ